MPLPTNPYIAGNPVGNTHAFIGRDDVLLEVLRILRNQNQNAITLFGQRRIGKTSVLQNLEERLPNEGKYLPVYFDLQDKAAWPIQKVIVELSRTIGEKLEIKPLDPDSQRDDFKKQWLPAVLELLKENASLVLLFDEFDVLADPKSTQAVNVFFAYLRELLSLNPERLQFLFVLGRNLSDLNQLALSLFKGIPEKRVSLLSKSNTYKLVTLSEENETLNWEKSALERIYTLACGHPFLTQALASQVWENAYDDQEDNENIPIVDIEMVDEAISSTLETSRNTLSWLWDGLGPAERIVVSALAEAGETIVSKVELEKILRESGVKILIRELKNAPQLLKEWDILEDVENGFRFRVELLRRWVEKYKPLSRVQEELDNIQPVAENLFQAARILYSIGDLDTAEKQLKQALEFSPEHIKANEMFVEILLSQDRLDESIELLERIIELSPSFARPLLVETYLEIAGQESSDDKKIALYNKVLGINSRQNEAQNGIKQIWKKRGDAALDRQDYEQAIISYKKGGLEEDLEEARRLLERTLVVRDGLAEIKDQENLGNYSKAISIAMELSSQYADMRDWENDIKLLESRAKIENLYGLGVSALNGENLEDAKKKFAEILQLDANNPKGQAGMQDVKRREQEIEKEEKHLLSLFIKGRTSLNNRRIPSARRAVLKIIEIRPDYIYEGISAKEMLEEIDSVLQDPDYKKRQRRMYLTIATVSVFVIVCSLSMPAVFSALSDFAGWLTGGTITPTTVVVALPTDTPIPPTDTRVPTTEIPLDPHFREKDEMVMLYVPSGVFRMGLNSARELNSEGKIYEPDNDEKPAHDVYLDAFWIDKTEVTNAMYVVFLNDKEYDTETALEKLNLIDIEDSGVEPFSKIKHENGKWQVENGFEDYPMIMVSWDGALAYCNWVGGRLPTEAEWEKAARGADERYIYPWGNEFDSSSCGHASLSGPCDGFDNLAPVGSFPSGASPYGVFDMTGNVAEWVNDFYGADYYNESVSDNPLGPDFNEDFNYVRRGGHWLSYYDATTTNRQPEFFQNMTNIVGFRCAATSVASLSTD